MDMVTERGEVRVRRVSEELEISPSSAHRLLATLAHRRYLVQDPTSKIYRPGAKLIDRRAPNADVKAASSFEITYGTRRDNNSGVSVVIPADG